MQFIHLLVLGYVRNGNMWAHEKVATVSVMLRCPCTRLRNGSSIIADCRRASITRNFSAFLPLNKCKLGYWLVYTYKNTHKLTYTHTISYAYI